jgi:hypothetical protein
MYSTLHQKDTDCQIGSKKQDPTICCLQETHLTTKDTHKLKVKDWKKIYQKQARVAILI